MLAATSGGNAGSPMTFVSTPTPVPQELRRRAPTAASLTVAPTDIVRGSGTGAISIGYYEGYNSGRKCLFQDALQIDTSKFTHIHFGFGTLTPSFDVETGDIRSTYNFGEFKKIKGAKRILSFGGWDFSTMPETYQIFRNGVKPANRLVMAQKIAAFIKDNNLDGVDIDWEYPGAPDLPDFDPGTKEDGPNYLAFLAVLKNLLPGKTVSIAAPASYWYLKQFPIAQIGKLVDYIVYMTYDLHGQWDANNGYSQEGCDDGNCLRSQVNLTETKHSLAMITKAGVPGNKIIVGVTSYGRSFKMAKEGC
jgi:GH18 family chitinase